MHRLVLLPLFLIVFIQTGFSQPVDLVIQTGHSGNVNGVAYSKDGKYIASACEDGSVKLWDARLGFEIFTFYDFNESGLAVCFTPDNKYLVGLGSQENVIWDLNTGKKTATLIITDEDGYESQEMSTAILSSDGKYCFTATTTIHRWTFDEILHPEKYAKDPNEINYDDDGLLRLDPPNSSIKYEGHSAPVTSLALTRDNKFLVSVSADSSIRIWDTQTGKLQKSIRNRFELSAVVISSDAKKIITAEKDTDDMAGLRIWDFNTGKQILHVPYKKGYANCLAISPDNKWLAAGALLKSIEVYALPSLKLMKELTGHTSWINSIDISSDGKFIVSGSEDNSLKIWEYSSGRLTKDMRRTVANIDAMAYDKAHRLLTTTSGEDKKQQTITWEIEKGIGIKNAYSSKYNLYNNDFLSIDSAGKTLMLTEDSSILLYDANSGKLKRKISVPFIGTAVLSPAAEYIIYQDRQSDDLFKLNTMQSSPDLFALFPDKDSNRVFSDLDKFDFSSDGKMIAGGGPGPDVFIWTTSGKYIRNLNYLDPDSSERISGEYHDNQSLALPNAMINDLRFSPDGKLIAAGCRMPDPLATGGLIIVWNVETGEMLHWVGAHNYIIQSIDWSADGKYLITGSNDKWLKVWRYDDFKKADPEPVFQFRNDFTPVHTSFTRDNKWLISAGIDGKLIIRNAADYSTIATLIGLNEIDFVAVLASQHYSASKKGTELIAFRQGNKIFPAEQFDIRFNRPDKVLEALGSIDTSLINSYRRAWYKRINRLGIDSINFRDDLSAPFLEILHRDTISYRQNKPELKLKLSAGDSVSGIKRLNVWVNEVPLFGQKGISYSENRSKLDTTITIKLSTGENRIESSVINLNGTESYRTPLIVRHEPVKPVDSKTYFIGIGIEQFENSAYNLVYSSKDIRDLSQRLKSKYGNNIIIDTIFNSQVTVDNIRQLKKRLLNTTENDKVIISYSGHGLLNSQFDYFLSTYNTNFEKPELNSLPYEELESLVDQIPARKKLLLIDACHSGEVDKEELVRINAASDSLKLIKGLEPVGYRDKKSLGLQSSFELMQNLFVNVGKSTGTTVISAAAGTQFALERNDLKNGVFTYSVLEAMQKNKSMKLSELKKYVAERVEQLTNGLQKPTYRNEMISVDWDVW